MDGQHRSLAKATVVFVGIGEHKMLVTARHVVRSDKVAGQRLLLLLSPFAGDRLAVVGEQVVPISVPLQLDVLWDTTGREAEIQAVHRLTRCCTLTRPLCQQPSIAALQPSRSSRRRPTFASSLGSSSRRWLVFVVRMRRRETAEDLTMVVPLDDEQKLDVSGPEPWLFKGRWDRVNLYGELKFSGGSLQLLWSDGDEMPIDMENRRVAIGAVFTAVASGRGEQYEVKDVKPMK